MALRTLQQKRGAYGQQWLMTLIAEHDDWLARALGEDYGVDIEVELDEREIRGEILKVQIKSSALVKQKEGRVKFTIERRYVEYAQSCRYPVLLILVDTRRKEAWYLWLQDWLLKLHRGYHRLESQQSSWTEWVSDQQTVTRGLDGELKAIASWKGETQFILSLIDALRAAAAMHNRMAIEALTNLISMSAPSIADVSLDALIDEAVILGDRMRGTHEGNVIADQLFTLVRKYGGQLSRSTVHDLVIRGDSYSRTGLTALGILYDEFFDHLSSLALPGYFLKLDHRQVAFYCALREAHPNRKSLMEDAKGFTFAGLRGTSCDFDKYANRGPSALLDCLVLVDNAQSGKGK